MLGMMGPPMILPKQGTRQGLDASQTHHPSLIHGTQVSPTFRLVVTGFVPPRHLLGDPTKGVELTN